jgi:hypothetical protein
MRRGLQFGINASENLLHMPIDHHVFVRRVDTGSRGDLAVLFLTGLLIPNRTSDHMIRIAVEQE